MFGCTVFDLSVVHCSKKDPNIFKRVGFRQWHTRARGEKKGVVYKYKSTGNTWCMPKVESLRLGICFRTPQPILKMSNYYITL